MAVEVGLPIFLGKLQNLLIACELPECKLLVDTGLVSIEDLESISVWIRDAKKLKVRSKGKLNQNSQPMRNKNRQNTCQKKK